MTKITDRKADRYLELFKAPKSVTVKAGVFEREGSEPHDHAVVNRAISKGAKGRAGKKADATSARSEEHRNAGTEGLTVAALAEIHEFGLGVPERSFIRAWFDQNQAEISNKLRERFREAALGKITFDVAADQFALWCQASIQKRMAAGIQPENAPSTVARKGSSKPLIDTGILRSSITAEATVDR